ncbi:hypothetical protein GGR28_003797 [Lewinella aquimaris]|uniref:Polymerase nucleotidyl transferase domain-containing protein n=1 Tax=Neolewinella aquimaris TaxID=1835722 RepID=A0A840EH60_9BACT|nr:nucleotidyltransferase domain-containing protein [Neolewinella aquimaris]MBB4081149.1 hypothetical protein [Neolewinella aquimaris]
MITPVDERRLKKIIKPAIPYNRFDKNTSIMTSSNLLKTLRENNYEIKKRFHAEIVAIYGSYARDEQSHDSDLDILYRIENPEKFGLVEIDGLENYLKNLVDVSSVDLVNEKYVNPIIQLEIENELLYV